MPYHFSLIIIYIIYTKNFLKDFFNTAKLVLSGGGGGGGWGLDINREDYDFYFTVHLACKIRVFGFILL